MLDFDEGDLVELPDGAGFHEVRLEYRAEIAPLACGSGYLTVKAMRMPKA